MRNQQPGRVVRCRWRSTQLALLEGHHHGQGSPCCKVAGTIEDLGILEEAGEQSADKDGR